MSRPDVALPADTVAVITDPTSAEVGLYEVKGGKTTGAHQHCVNEHQDCTEHSSQTASTPSSAPGAEYNQTQASHQAAVAGLVLPEESTDQTCPGRPAWWELLTPRPLAAEEFYRESIGVITQTLDTPEGAPRYIRFKTNGRATAGISDAGASLSQPVPSRWRVYFRVESCDGAAKEVLRLGGKIAEAPTSGPYGRFCSVIDPLGARFRLIAPRV